MQRCGSGLVGTEGLCELFQDLGVDGAGKVLSIILEQVRAGGEEVPNHLVLALLAEIAQRLAAARGSDNGHGRMGSFGAETLGSRYLQIEQLSEGNWEITPNFPEHGNGHMIFVHGPDVIQTVGDAIKELGLEVVGFDNVRFLGLIEKNHPIYVSNSKLPDENRRVNGKRLLAQGDVKLKDGRMMHYYVLDDSDSGSVAEGRRPIVPNYDKSRSQFAKNNRAALKETLSVIDSKGGDFAVVSECLLFMCGKLFDEFILRSEDFSAIDNDEYWYSVFQGVTNLDLSLFDLSQPLDVILQFHDPLVKRLDKGLVFANFGYRISQGDKLIEGRLSVAFKIVEGC
jgi:hypothetical protein